MPALASSVGGSRVHPITINPWIGKWGEERSWTDDETRPIFRTHVLQRPREIVNAILAANLVL